MFHAIDLWGDRFRMAILWSVGDAAASIFPGLLSPADLLLFSAKVQPKPKACLLTREERLTCGDDEGEVTRQD
jgi:hypothetical protein